MPKATSFLAGEVVTTRNLRDASSNPTRTAASLVREGVLTKVQGGLYYAPRRTRWGEAPPSAEALLTAWLDGQQDQDWLMTGTAVWNTLGLGSTAVQVRPWVYNRKRSGIFNLAGHALHLRRVPFPPNPPVEWFVVDLLNHYREAASDLADLQHRLAKALADHSFDSECLREQARVYGRKWTQRVIEQSIAAKFDSACDLTHK